MIISITIINIMIIITIILYILKKLNKFCIKHIHIRLASLVFRSCGQIVKHGSVRITEGE